MDRILNRICSIDDHPVAKLDERFRMQYAEGLAACLYSISEGSDISKMFTAAKVKDYLAGTCAKCIKSFMKTNYILLALLAAVLLTACTAKTNLYCYSINSEGALTYTAVPSHGETLVNTEGDSVGTLVGRQLKKKKICYNMSGTVLAMVHAQYVKEGAPINMTNAESRVIFVRPKGIFTLTGLPEYTGEIPSHMTINKPVETVRILTTAEDYLNRSVKESQRGLPQRIDPNSLLTSIKTNNKTLVISYAVDGFFDQYPPEKQDEMMEDVRINMLQFAKDMTAEAPLSVVKELGYAMEYHFFASHGVRNAVIRYEADELR